MADASKTFFMCLLATLFVLSGMTMEHFVSLLLDWWMVPNLRFFGLSELTLATGIGYCAAFLMSAVLAWQKRCRQLLMEVIDELLKVAWPTFAETRHATFVVIVTVLLCSVYLGLLDAVILSLTNWLLAGRST